MHCKKCGKESANEDTFCKNCGDKINSESSLADFQECRKKSSKNKRIGLILLIGPIVMLILTLVVFGIVSFISNSMGASEVALSVIKVTLGFVGIISVIGIMIGIPLGIVFFAKKEMVEGAPFDERSGKGDFSEIPNEIKGWNWGAAGLTWIWGLYHRVWISVLVFIPFVNIVMWIILGIKGSEWAWRKEKWLSVEEFKYAQRKWKPWGIAFFILSILSMFIAFSE